ncbi:MAG: hypothetical protein Q4A28_05595 [Brachymonas sp.]|nr:hypothetical protein [Brachymonas sp.]
MSHTSAKQEPARTVLHMARRRACGIAALAGAAWGCLMPALAQAHGALLEQQIVPAIAVRAMYDTGEPMTTAQITVYAPNDPAKPWLTGKADPQGHFRFVPDPAIPGQWTIQAREAGHGALIYVTLGNENAAPASAASANASSGAASAQASVVAQPAVSSQANQPLQRWVMVACVVWGFIGTALFFARKTRNPQIPQNPNKGPH